MRNFPPGSCTTARISYIEKWKLHPAVHRRVGHWLVVAIWVHVLYRSIYHRWYWGMQFNVASNFYRDVVIHAWWIIASCRKYSTPPKCCEMKMISSLWCSIHTYLQPNVYVMSYKNSNYNLELTRLNFLAVSIQMLNYFVVIAMGIFYYTQSEFQKLNVSLMSHVPLKQINVYMIDHPSRYSRYKLSIKEKGSIP